MCKHGKLSKILYKENQNVKFLTSFSWVCFHSMLTDSDEIANEFNNYFVNIGRLLSEQTTSPNTSEEYLGNRSNFHL